VKQKRNMGTGQGGREGLNLGSEGVAKGLAEITRLSMTVIIRMT